MGWIKGLIWGALVLLILLLGILFTIHNTQQVSIDLVFLQLPEASLSIWLVASFALGGVLGLVLSLIALLSLRTRLHRTHRKLKHSTEELDKLRNLPLESGH